MLWLGSDSIWMSWFLREVSAEMIPKQASGLHFLSNALINYAAKISVQLIKKCSAVLVLYAF